jgi:hypothetical protein
MWAAAIGWFFEGGISAMSYNLESKSVFDALSFLNRDAMLPFAAETAAHRAEEERAVDFALRNVPLPDGLLTRLGKLVYTLPDETADQVDWLGC